MSVDFDRELDYGLRKSGQFRGCQNTLLATEREGILFMPTTETLENLIANHPFLKGLDRRYHQNLAECASFEHVALGKEIFHQDGCADRFYLITSGKVALETFVPGCGMVTIQTLGPGEALGWSWLFPPRRWHFTASAVEPTELITFDAAMLLKKAEEDRPLHCELIARVARILFDRLQATRMQLIDFYGMRP